MLIVFANSNLMEFQGEYFALHCLFSVIGAFKCFYIESICMNTLLMLVFLKAPFLVLHFSYHILMIFLMMPSVILLSVLKILISTRSVIQFASVHWSYNSGTIDVKMDGSVLEEKSSLKTPLIFPFHIGFGFLYYLYCQNCLFVSSEVAL